MFVTSEELIKKVNADSPVDTEDFLNAYYPYFKIFQNIMVAFSVTLTTYVPYSS